MGEKISARLTRKMTEFSRDLRAIFVVALVLVPVFIERYASSVGYAVFWEDTKATVAALWKTSIGFLSL